jgi:hypothetical protein
LKLTVPQLLEKSFRMSDIATTPAKKWLTLLPRTIYWNSRLLSLVLYYRSCYLQIPALISMLFQQQNSTFLIVTLIFWSLIQCWILLKFAGPVLLFYTTICTMHLFRGAT